MTAVSPGPHLFSVLTDEHDTLFRTRRDTFLLSLLGQAAILALIIYFTGCIIRNPPEIARRMPDLGKFPLVFSGFNGGGGGNEFNAGGGGGAGGGRGGFGGKEANPGSTSTRGMNSPHSTT